MPPYAPPAPPQSSPDGPIVVLGDTQRTTLEEVVFMWREQNEAARLALIKKIATEEHPAFVVHLGDMVESGGSAQNWEYFDRLISPLTARKIQIFPVLGNHDHWGSEKALRRSIQKRFPVLGANGFYTKEHAGLGLVWLDSNLDGEVGAQQSAWLDQVLAGFGRNDAVRGVVLFMHHPAYTNGKRRHGEPYVQREVLPRFFAAPKTVALMSGHVHGYERFVVRGREFVVTAGGGGPRVEYLLPPEAPYVPAYNTKTDARRPFNYVVMQPTSSGLDFTVKCLNTEGDCPSGILERFAVAFPTADQHQR